MLEPGTVLNDSTGAIKNNTGVMSRDYDEQLDTLVDFNKVLLQLIGTHADGIESYVAAKNRLAAAREYINQRGDITLFLE